MGLFVTQKHCLPLMMLNLQFYLSQVCDSGRKNVQWVKNKENICMATVQSSEALYWLEDLRWLRDNRFRKEDALKLFYEPSAKTSSRFSLSYHKHADGSASIIPQHQRKRKMTRGLHNLQAGHHKCQLWLRMFKWFGEVKLPRWQTRLKSEWWPHCPNKLWYLVSVIGLETHWDWVQSGAQFDKISLNL